MNNIAGEWIPIILFLVIALIVKIVFDARIRQKLIESGNIKDAQYLFRDSFERYVPSSLKWGIVLIAVGLALFIGQVVSYRISDEVTFSLMFLFGGLGLVIYYFIATRAAKKAKDQELLDQVSRS